jgi:hypothetical protein
VFPQLGPFNPTTNTLFSFYDKIKRPIIVLYSIDAEGIMALLTKMENLKHFDTKSMVQK